MSSKIPNFIDYQVGKAAKSDVADTAIAQDQDTVIGDAMCHAAQIVYDLANTIARFISDNAQYAIDLKELRRAELALAYMQGVDFGLAMDDKRCKTYLAYMEKTMASIRRSKEAGFQLQIDVPPEPSKFLGYDANHCRAMGDMFLHSLNDAPPDSKRIKELEDEMYRAEGKDSERLVPSPEGQSGCMLVMADLPESAAEDAAIEKRKNPKSIRREAKENHIAMENDPSNKKAIISDAIQDAAKNANAKITSIALAFVRGDDDDDGWNINIGIVGEGDSQEDSLGLLNKVYDTLKSKGYNLGDAVAKNGADGEFAFKIYTGVSDKIGPSADAAPEVNRLRDLLRTNRISKEAFCGGIATLMATGIIGKSEFTRLSTLAK